MEENGKQSVKKAIYIIIPKRIKKRIEFWQWNPANPWYSRLA